MTKDEVEIFRLFCEPLLGLTISHVWRGYGSAIFVEFGELKAKIRRDGSPGNPKGDVTLCIEWSWRIEGKRRIWCGSWSDEDRLLPVLRKLVGARVEAFGLFGRIGEVELSLSNGLHLISFMTERGDPSWSLTNQDHVSIDVVAGRLHLDYRDQIRLEKNADA